MILMDQKWTHDGNFPIGVSHTDKIKLQINDKVESNSGLPI